MASYSLSHLSDPVLLRDLVALVAKERATIAELLAHLAEVDARRLYLPAAYPSMYAWCVGVLRLSEDSAFKRIRAARTAREFPAIFAMLADGRLNLSSLLLLAPHLTPDTADELLGAAARKTNGEIEQLLAERFPRPDVPTLLLGTTAGGQFTEGVEEHADQLAARPVCESGRELAAGHVHPGGARTRVEPLSPGRFALQVTLAQDTHDKLRYAQALLGHAVPSGDLAQVLDRALDALIAKLEQRRFAACVRARPSRGRNSENGRYIPAAVRRIVAQRDGGQCTFVSESGHRCDARTRLEFDHVDPVARGGQSTPDGLRLRCRAHNQYAAERVFGTEFMKHKREKSKTRPTIHGPDASQAPRPLYAPVPACEASLAPTCPSDDIIPWLRRLGFRMDEARRGAQACAHISDAPLEARVRTALATLAPHSARRSAAVSSSPV